MSYQGKVVVSEPYKNSYKVTFETSKGEWTMYNKQIGPSVKVGDEVEFEAHKEGKFWSLDSVKVLSKTGSPSNASDDTIMRFVSNVVGNAIQSGAITNPQDIKAWVNAAKTALDDSEPDFLDEDIPM